MAVVATTDDESPGPTKSYRPRRDAAVIGLATSRRDSHGEIDPLIYPRLIDWSDGMIGSPFSSDCVEDSSPPFLLFGEPCQKESKLWCPRHTIAESSPGVGRCVIQITTPEPITCDPRRGWVNPLASNGDRRPRVTKGGERICEVIPVTQDVMDACIHDESCADCGSGWCVSEVLPLAKFCQEASSLPIRWAGGALPSPGVVHITCLERLDGAPP